MHPLRRLLQHAEAHRSTVKRAITASVLNKLFDLAPPALIGAAVDVVVNQQDSLLARWGVQAPEDQLLLLAAATVFIWLMESIFEYVYGVLWRNLAQTVQHELRLDAYRHIQDLDMAWFSSRPRGELMSVLNDDVNQLERFLDGGANSMLQVLTTAVVVGAVFFAASPLVALFAIVPIPFILGGSFWFQGRIAPRYAAVRSEVGHLNALLDNNLSGIGTIKSFVAEEHEARRVAAASGRYRAANREAIRLSAAFTPLIRMVIVVGFVATMLIGGWLTLDGAMAVGTYSVLVFLVQRLLWPLTRLGETFDLFQRAMASTERVLDLLDTPITLVEGQHDGSSTGTALPVSFSEVGFAYAGRPPVVTAFSLDVPAGHTVAFVGSTGSGKTTLIRLLMRFFDPAEGAVSLDGVDVRDWRLSALRQQLALVEQRVFLFPGSVRDNIAYGRPDATDADVEDAARMADAHAFIVALPQGYKTMLGEDGLTLSGGQRQRLSIARALLKAAPVLVLDEATSAVDNETEAAIQQSLARIAGHRTTLVIAHRLSTIRHANTIVVLEAGTVAEKGTHDELVAMGGRYARLWRIQTGAAVA